MLQFLNGTALNPHTFLSRFHEAQARGTNAQEPPQHSPISKLKSHPGTDYKMVRAPASPFLLFSCSSFTLGPQLSCLTILHASEGSQVLCFEGF